MAGTVNPGIVMKKESPLGKVLGGIAAVATTILTGGAGAGAAAGIATSTATEGIKSAADFGKDIAFGSALKGTASTIGSSAAAQAPSKIKQAVDSATSFGGDVQQGMGVGQTVQNIVAPQKAPAQGLPAMERKTGLNATAYTPSSVLENQLAQYRRRIGG